MTFIQTLKVRFRDLSLWLFGEPLAQAVKEQLLLKLGQLEGFQQPLFGSHLPQYGEIEFVVGAFLDTRRWPHVFILRNRQC